MITDPKQLAVHRKMTQKFIDDDPTEIVLTPRTVSWNAGTKTMVSGLPRDSQKFKLLLGGGTGVSGQGLVVAASGTTREFDFLLVGAYDASVAIGDYWKVDNQDFEVEWIAPFNNYEVKCGGTSHGAHPLRGPNSG